MSSDTECPGCGEAGHFVEEYAEWREKPMPFTSGKPDRDSQLMECETDDCRVHRYLPTEDDDAE